MDFMSEKKYVVPEGMLNAFHDALCHTREVDEDNALEAALRWLGENPIVPTHDQIDEMQIACDLPAFAHHGFERICEEWQLRMFLAPEPGLAKDGTVEFLTGSTRPVAIWWQGKRWPIATIAEPEPRVPEQIKDLWEASPTPDTKKRTIEAYRRGQSSLRKE